MKPLSTLSISTFFACHCANKSDKQDTLENPMPIRLTREINWKRGSELWPGVVGLALTAACLVLPVLTGSAQTGNTNAAAYTWTTLAGRASDGSADGVGDGAQFNRPSFIAVDSAGNIYVADSVNNTIRKVTAAGVVSTLAGTAG